MRRVLAV
jgi:arsenite methyltransferase